MKEYKIVTVPEHTKRELALIRCDICTVTVTDNDSYYVVDEYTNMGVSYGTAVRVPIYLCNECLNKIAETNT